ncbi:MAG: OmpP1/FadL family transporter [Candidatus Aminicenantia bacterium]
MKKLFIPILMVLMVFGISGFTFGGGFLIYEHGAAAMAQAGAFVARTYDPTAIFHNPAGIAWLDGTQISVGTTLIVPKGSLELPNYSLLDPTWPGSVDQEGQIFYPSTFYITHRFNDKISFGLGFFSPFGLGTEWPEDFPLRYISYKTSMKTFYINPTVAYQVNENFSIGAGVSYIYADIEFKHYSMAALPMPPWTLDYGVSLEGKDSFAIGFNAGLLYKDENWSVGSSYRSRATLNLEGDVIIDPPAGWEFLFPETEMKGSTDMHLPDIFTVGGAYEATDKLVVEVDVQYNIWSVYDKLVLEVEGQEDQEIEQDWDNAFIFRIGGEYQLNENLALRAGVLYDPTPQPVKSMDSSLPDANRWAFTAGLGYKKNNFTIDFAYQFEPFNDRESPNRDIYDVPLLGINFGEGTYSTTAHLFGISIGYIF